MIILKNICKKINNKKILDNISLTINKGKIFCIMGHSGAGKTTLLNIISLLDNPTAGEYIFNNQNPYSDIVKFRRKITMVFQEPILFNTSVFENVAYGLKVRNYDKEEIRERVEYILEKVGMLEYINKKAKYLSGGEKQRVSIARALVIEPEVLVLDEPTANLDYSNTLIIEKIIKDFKDKDRSIIIATHNLFQVRRLADEVAHLYYGRLIEVGKTDDIFNNPKHNLTKKFINGEMFF